MPKKECKKFAHTVEITEIYSHRKKIRENNSHSNSLVKKFDDKVLIHTVEITEIYSHRKKFRQINYLVISLIKMLLSRNFCHKRVRD